MINTIHVFTSCHLLNIKHLMKIRNYIVAVFTLFLWVIIVLSIYLSTTLSKRIHTLVDLSGVLVLVSLCNSLTSLNLCYHSQNNLIWYLSWCTYLCCTMMTFFLDGKTLFLRNYIFPSFLPLPSSSLYFVNFFCHIV